MAIKVALLFLNLFLTIEGKGLTFVIDTALSMKSEIEYVQSGLSRFLDTVSNQVQSFVVVPFNEPDIGPITITEHVGEFKTVIRGLTGKGNRDCPFISMMALKHALDSSENKSHIYFFTDAYTDDFGSISMIKDQCQRSSSQVTIVLTRTCSPNNLGYVNTNLYEEISEACGGRLIVISPYNLRLVLNYIPEELKWEQQDFSVDKMIRCDSREHKISIDTSSSEVLILVTGNIYYITFHDESNSTRAENVMNSRTFKAYHIKNPTNVRMKCRGDEQTSVKIASKNNRRPKYKSPFIFGFAPFKPTVMKETTLKPISTWNVYMLVASLEKSLVPVQIEIISSNNKENKRVLNLTETYADSKTYVTGAFYIPSKYFTIMVHAYDVNGKTGDILIFSSEHEIFDTEAPNPMKPKIEIIELNPNNVEYGGERRIACLITGYPRPVILWQDDKNNRYDSVNNILEIPNVYISHVNIKNITRNITYSCSAYNNEGRDQRYGHIIVNFMPKFNIIEAPMDMAVEIESEATLNCKVDAAPKATVTWYYNNTMLGYKYNINIEDDKLVIMSMSLDDVGLYSCEVKNGLQTKVFNASITVTGLEAPTVFFNSSDVVHLKVGSSLDLTCGYKGKPNPTITWKYWQLEVEKLQDLPHGVSVYDGDLSILNVKAHHAGFYRCVADNVIGSNCKDIQIIVGAPPIIVEDISSLTTRMRNQVELRCEVQSDSNVTVYWELKKHDEEVSLGHHQITDKQNTLRFLAQWNDDGVYTCIAENDAGVAEKSIAVTVLVPPYIQTRSPKILTVEIGGNVTIPCDVLYGNPTPKLRWHFKPYDSIKHIVLSPEPPEALNLINVSSSNEGEYLCTATNDAGYDAIKVILRLNTHYEII